MEDDFRFKKVFGLIPVDLFDKLSSQNKFKDNWDSFLTAAIREKLEKEAIDDAA
jgi:hypothetical protein